MDTRTGEIVSMEYVKKLQEQKSPEAKFFKEIPYQYLPALEGLNRKERRQWYRRNKKLLKDTR